MKCEKAMGFFHPIRDYRRRALGRAPFPSAWSQIIDQQVPCCSYLSQEEKERLQKLVKVFVAEKHFEGCRGLIITEEMKVIIAAQACLLLLNLRHNYYEQLVSILVYPESFKFEQEERGPLAGTVTLTEMPVSGLSSSHGVVVLSWPDTAAGARRPDDGRNVVFHEFAHQLDQMEGTMNGAPLLDSAALYREWAQVLGAEYKRLQDDVETHAPTLISGYGATKPAEFFAVVTELFFERPLELQQQHPALYDEFKRYYRQDTAARLQGRPVG